MRLPCKNTAILLFIENFFAGSKWPVSQQIFSKCSADVILSGAFLQVQWGQSKRERVRISTLATSSGLSQSKGQITCHTQESEKNTSLELNLYLNKQALFSLIPVFLLTRTGLCASRPLWQHGLLLFSPLIMSCDRTGRKRSVADHARKLAPREQKHRRTRLSVPLGWFAVPYHDGSNHHGVYGSKGC